MNSGSALVPHVVTASSDGKRGGSPLETTGANPREGTRWTLSDSGLPSSMSVKSRTHVERIPVKGLASGPYHEVVFVFCAV